MSLAEKDQMIEGKKEEKIGEKKKEEDKQEQDPRIVKLEIVKRKQKKWLRSYRESLSQRMMGTDYQSWMQKSVKGISLRDDTFSKEGDAPMKMREEGSCSLWMLLIEEAHKIKEEASSSYGEPRMAWVNPTIWRFILVCSMCCLGT